MTASGYLSKLLDTVNKLAYATDLLRGKPQFIWEKQLQWSILALFEALLVSLLLIRSRYSSLCLCQSLANELQSDTRSAVLQATGVVWQAAKELTEDTPSSESAAFTKAMRSLLDTSQDALDECKELTRAPSKDGEAIDDFDDDDDDDSLTPEQVERASAVCVLVRLARLLLKKVMDTHTQGTARSNQAIYENATTVQERIDDLVASCHPPQDLEELASNLKGLEAACKVFQPAPTLPALSTLSLNGATKAATDKTDDKWIDMCLMQISKASAKIAEQVTSAPSRPTA